MLRLSHRPCVPSILFFQIHRPCLLGFFPVILKHLYDADIVEEDALLEWASELEPSDEYTPTAISIEQFAVLRKKAEPFVVWLQQADEEDDEDEVRGQVG